MGIEDRTVLLYGPKPMPKRKKEDDVLKLTCMKREEAIKVFERYETGSQKITY